MKKPIIGITGSCLYEPSAGLFAGYERMYTNTDYVNAVLAAGGVPLMLPIINDEEAVRQQIENLSGIIIMGGYDVEPHFFNEEPLSCLGEILPKRDIYELKLIKAARALKKPILGICRGMQLLNVAFGGSLYQDLSLIKRNIQIKHDQDTRPQERTHSIKIEDNSVMQKVFGKEDMVNSYHHQAVKTLAKDFKITAYAPDGIVEAIEYTGDCFIMGVQFHPEMTAAVHKPSLDLFKEFIGHC
ncbi:gamma-glutamyl-gamma-aminobutyrate hydrolase family protein [Treponema sp. OMZ 792]|uniref:gamma-glutamyl-gamma-aminobutyrate hydrolase family protein n=1 Tax=unclassified Treponema TaxID=2638727 RepID=UPI0020A283F1|nr:MULTISPECIES: gamma-glutamyl-gamma-aminobutyrate hydrolase family protein [unclassified Treponema]UTC74774.1 gamma-glutamyl-gamma-aminobutyrate hydrolase family protein [Treponema sp. OMZ 792]UTC81168.1 gamma-glutamyl-gamma-aminobutyrate hydrolase family protein [Treponema sp. OMZ 798]